MIWFPPQIKPLKNCFHQELKNMTFLDYIGKIQQQSLFNFLHLVVRHACARSISINKRWNRTKAGIISHERQKGGTSTRRQSNLVICTWSIRPGRWTIFFSHFKFGSLCEEECSRKDHQIKWSPGWRRESNQPREMVTVFVWFHRLFIIEIERPQVDVCYSPIIIIIGL